MTVPMLMMPQPTARTRFADWPFALKSIIGFWFFYSLTGRSWGRTRGRPS